MTAEQEVIELVQKYGGGVDFGGRGARRYLYKAAQRLVASGILSGSVRNASLASANGEIARDKSDDSRV